MRRLFYCLSCQRNSAQPNLDRVSGSFSTVIFLKTVWCKIFEAVALRWIQLGFVNSHYYIFQYSRKFVFPVCKVGFLAVRKLEKQLSNICDEAFLRKQLTVKSFTVDIREYCKYASKYSSLRNNYRRFNPWFNPLVPGVY